MRVIPTPGHTPGHQSILIAPDGDEGAKALFLGDMVPTSVHVPLPWIMGYDLEPVRTLETKRNLWTRAAAERWLLLFGHDPGCDGAFIAADQKGGFSVEKKIRLAGL